MLLHACIPISIELSGTHGNLSTIWNFYLNTQRLFTYFCNIFIDNVWRMPLLYAILGLFVAVLAIFTIY